MGWLQRCVLALPVAAVSTVAFAAGAGATSLTPGDVVIYRVGSGSEALTSSATSAYLDEFEAGGSLAATLPLPTSTNGSNKPLVASGSAGSEGFLTLSSNDNFLLATGYGASVGTANVAETSAKTVPRTIARVSANGEINTTTALTDFANENNPRSATSSDGTKIWVGGTGKGTTGGVHFTTLGATTSTSLNETDTNVRQVEIFNGQLYTSADPTKVGALTIASVGAGLPSTKGQTIANLPFATSPEQPFAYSMLALGLGPAPDTIYVADNKLGAVAKYGLLGGKWTKQGSVEVPDVTGVTANDVNGLVTIYATSAGAQSRAGTLYKIADVSGVNGTLSGIPVEIATAPANEAYRGVAFAPGTTIGSGGTPPPAPTITAAENTLTAAFGDPTNQSLPITVEDPAYEPGELTVKVESSNPAVAPVGGITVTGTGKERSVSVNPSAVGTSKLTLTVEAPNGVFSSTQVNYGVSEYQGDPSDRYYAGAGNAATAVDAGGGYMIVGDDATNVLHLYHSRISSEPVRSYDFTSQLPYGATEINIHSSARVGNTLYWVGALDNTNSGEPRPAHDVIFAATITGSGANTALTYLGSYTHLREDLIEWDNVNGKPLGFAESAQIGQPAERPNGFKLEGLEFAAGSSSEAFVAFRAPLESTETRTLALVIPVTNFSSLVNGNPGTTPATFGTPLEWNLGGLSVRQIRKNSSDEYVVLASTADSSDTSFQLYGWNGEPEEPPILLGTPTIAKVAEGVWDSMKSVPAPITNGSQVELLEDNGNTVWYANGKTAKKGLTPGLQKDLGRLFSVQIPEPGIPSAPQQSAGPNPSTGGLSLNWKPAPTLRRTYKLEHQNALGGWATVTSGFSRHEYTFAPGHEESEGTWTYRVSERNESGESAPSAVSEAIKVDRTPPQAPTATASRPPDYTGKGGWYKDTVTVSFTDNGDPLLADGSSPSGVEPSSLTAPETFGTSGSHTASGVVSDKVGNVSQPGTLAVQVDATAPSLEVQCPATAFVGEANVTATVTASDGESGLASDPTGTVPIDTGSAGPFTVTLTAVDNVGHETTRSCTTQIHYPTPGPPSLTAGTSPNANGQFTLGWTGADPLHYLGLGYTLEHHNAATQTWSTVAQDIEALSYEFSSPGEAEGTWLYRVQGSDPGRSQTTEFSPPSAPVVVDRTPPSPPSASASRAPDYAGNGGWYKDSTTVSFSDDGDPALADGSPGTGVEPGSVTAPETFTTSGSHTASGTVADKVGNVSLPGTLAVQVDASAPTVEVTCPPTANVGQSGVSATVAASDGQSGLSSDPSGTVPIDTTWAGPVTIARTAVDNVGHKTTTSCTTQVLESPPEFGRCVKAPSEKVGGKTVYHGWFTASCLVKSATQTSTYEWVPRVTKVGFSTVVKPETKVILETVKKAQVTCTGGTSSGTITGAKTVGGVVMSFTGCFAPTGKCTSPGRPEGELRTNTLEGALGVEAITIKEGKETRYVGLDLYPVGGTGAFIEYTCKGKPATTLSGSLIGRVPADKMFTTATLKYAAAGGKQKPERFEGGPTDVLTNGTEQVGLADTVTQTNQEAFEINAFF